MSRNFSSSFLQEAYERGFVYQCTDIDGLDELLSKEKVTFYIGCDATADSFHVGHLVQILMLRLLQKHGHRPVLLIGGATTKIGDPSGRDNARPTLTDQEIAYNTDGLRKCLEPYIQFGDELGNALLVNNADWLDKLSYIHFLKGTGRYFSVNRMLTFDTVKSRLEREQPLSLLEFNYMIMQAYDFLELFDRHSCKLQIGGSDQWGNIVCGTDLIRRARSTNVYGLTTPLLSTSDGKKMGKSADGAVWLCADKLSPYDFWQYWRNVDDRDVGRFLRLFTDLPLDEICRLEQLQGQSLNDAKIILADEITRLTHGRETLETVRTTTQSLFGEGAMITAGELLSGPIYEMERESTIGRESIVDLFVKTCLVSSRSEARRLIKGKGAYLNDQPVLDDILIIKDEHFDENSTLRLSAGKKRIAVVKLI
ncbi:MAG: tyrosine--tRNA ligase [Holosporales bacterium]|jgi:tyrosyl-tRNA synthetase|nr:tyrosine--tRNA ligase [Holosporales bacterium]